MKHIPHSYTHKMQGLIDLYKTGDNIQLRHCIELSLFLIFPRYGCKVASQSMMLLNKAFMNCKSHGFTCMHAKVTNAGMSATRKTQTAYMKKHAIQ